MVNDFKKGCNESRTVVQPLVESYSMHIVRKAIVFLCGFSRHPVYGKDWNNFISTQIEPEWSPSYYYFQFYTKITTHC